MLQINQTNNTKKKLTQFQQAYSLVRNNTRKYHKKTSTKRLMIIKQNQNATKGNNMLNFNKIENVNKNLEAKINRLHHSQTEKISEIPLSLVSIQLM